jgi:hypothetical protein
VAEGEGDLVVWCPIYGRQVKGWSQKIGTPQKRGLCCGCKYKNPWSGNKEPSLVRTPHGLWCRHNLTNEQALLIDLNELAKIAKEAGLIA